MIIATILTKNSPIPTGNKLSKWHQLPKNIRVIGKLTTYT